MIIDLVLDFFQAIVEGFLGLIPTVGAVESWASSAGSMMAQLGVWAAPMSAWVPLAFMIQVVGSVLIFRGGMLLLGFALRVYGLIRGGGDR